MAPRFSRLGATSSLLQFSGGSWQPLLALLLLLALVGLLLPLCGSSGKEKKKKRRRHHGGDASDNYYDDYYDDYEEDSYGEETNYRGRTRGGRRNDHRQGKSRGSPRTLGGGGRASDKRETTVGEEKSIGASYYTALLKKNKVKSVSQYLRKF